MGDVSLVEALSSLFPSKIRVPASGKTKPHCILCGMWSWKPKKPLSFKLHSLVAVLLLTGCGDSTTAPPTPPTPPTPVATSVTVSPTSLLFASLGDSQQLSATVKDQNGATMASATVTWTTSAASVATVSSTGLVTSVGDGSATITATSGSAIATASVSVGQVIAAVSLSDSALTFLADTTQLTATVTDTNGQVIDRHGDVDYIATLRDRIIYGSRDFRGSLGHDHRHIWISDCDRERERR